MQPFEPVVSKGFFIFFAALFFAAQRKEADAWYALTVRGMNHIVCKSAVFDEAGRLRFTGKEMRLCG